MSIRLLAFVVVCLLSIVSIRPALSQPVADVPAAITADIQAGAPAEALIVLDDSGLDSASPAAGLPDMPFSRHSNEEYRRLMERRVETLRVLKSRIKQELLADVSGFGLEVLTDYSALPILHVRIDSPEALQRLIDHPQVKSIDENATMGLFLNQSLPLIRQPQAFVDGYDGAGTSVCVLDTGVDYTHPDFGPCTAPNVPSGTCKVAFAADFAPPDGQLDDDGHGTNVAATVLGVAPAAKIIDADVFMSNGRATFDDIIEAIDWCVVNRATYNITALNMSLGGGFSSSPVNPTDAFGTAIGNAVRAGIAVVAASGNEATKNGLGLPAAYSNVISVGAVYDQNIGRAGWSNCVDSSTFSDLVTCFSNSASFLTLLAPGALISAGGEVMGGTSQAAPHVAGAAAVASAANPRETVAQISERLQRGPQVVDPANGISKPRLDLVDTTMDIGGGNSTLFNLSTRAAVRAGDEILIGGFVINGVGLKRVLIRARGPSLADAGVPNAMPDPTLRLFSGPSQIGMNDNWRAGGQEAEIIATGRAPSYASESALIAVLSPGPYTVLVEDARAVQGAAIFEVIGIDEEPGINLFNVATRAKVETGDNVAIGGFVIRGDDPKQLLIRARGPSLANAGVRGALSDTIIELFSGQTLIAANDDWAAGGQRDAIAATGKAPPHNFESAILSRLAPGPYTVLLRGYNGAQGVGIIEVIAIDEQ
ncbi:MAG: S8 family serine peptidase [Thiohalocapsa sp.]|nr:S8 family serine peptidase [Thiohalocapsa sp.]MCF7992109.1 S8 family serine peptidase [Thiohalocapsa sp.]